ncbi:MAG: tetraacyldisaccharide 4'-kinase, partial [Proteobacteria bacterium]|nr:tetraacyldisaccharide 4'-kinase [Pseudomonadota bacterium]
QQGLRPGVISRGYGGRSQHYPLEVTGAMSAAEVGDEPLMIYQRTGVPVVVDPDRVQAARALLDSHDCDVVVSDDGLQHYALARDIEIAVIDGERGFGNGLCLPAGPLREPVSRLLETDLIVVNGSGKQFAGAAGVEQMSMRVVPTRFVNMTSAMSAPLDTLAGKTVHAVAGIGNPHRFFNSLKDLGCSVIPHQFPDHHVFDREDVTFEDDLAVVMTEKDAVKFDHSLIDGPDFWYLEVSAGFDEALIDRLLRSLPADRAILEPLEKESASCP